MDHSVHTILTAHFPYYNKLSSEGRKKFEGRLNEFIQSKAFEARGNFVITEKVKVLISACAIQLTFGLDKFMFRHFSKILVYPDQFYSPFSKSMNVGEVNTAGIIVLSWKAFEDGLKKENDSFNVGLHELAHALNLTDLMGKDIDKRFSVYFDKWYVYARKILRNKQSGERSFFRKYAGKNLQEFFAVGVEYFFEQPAAFRQNMPQLYKHFANLLNQDPMERDYILKFEPGIKIITDSSARPIHTFIPKRSQSHFYLELFSPLIIILILYFVFEVEWLVLALFLIFYGFRLFSIRSYLQIEVYENCIQAKHLKKLFDTQDTYPLHDIISLNYIDDSEGADCIQLKLYKEGKIIDYSIPVYTDFDSFLSFFKYMFEEKNIAVKHNGTIFIPDEKHIQ